MSKTTANIILIALDFFCFWGLWSGGQEFLQILADIHNLVEAIHYGNRISFFIVGIVLPIIHFLAIVGHFRPAWIRKYSKWMNWVAVILLAGSFAGGIFGSFYLTNSLKSAGYIYCRKASGISALAKSVVYTINDEVCEEVAATQRRRF